jgi:hypothetical protein
MRWLLFVLTLPVVCFGQNVTFNVNHDTSVHTYSLPVRCPSTNSTDLATCASNGNQALNGAGSIFPECDLNPSTECTTPGPPYSASAVHVIRVTDQNTGGSGGYQYTYHPQPSQGAGDNSMDATDTRFVLTQSGGWVMVFSLDPNPSSSTYLKTQQLYGKSYALSSSTAWFSKLLPPYPNGQTVSLFYALQKASNVPGLTGHSGHPVIMSYDFSSATVGPTVANGGVKVVVDLATVPNCLPSGYTMQWTGVLSASDDDQTFSAAFGPQQDQATYVVVWNRSKGCRVWHTDTATVSGSFGSNGTITDTTNNGGPAKFYVHESQIFHDGAKVYVEGQTCVSGNNCKGSAGAPRFNWETGIPYSGNSSPSGLQTWSLLDYSNCGHNTQGYNRWINKCIRFNSDGAFTVFERPYNNNLGWALLDPGAPASSCYQLSSPYNQMVCPGGDQHASWANNVDGTDTAPVFYTNFAQWSPVKGKTTVPDTPYFPWDNEIQAMPTACWNGNGSGCSGSLPYRIAHTYSDPEQSHSAGFIDYQAIGAVSARPAYGQYFYLFTSSWQGQLGCQKGGYSSQAMGLGCPVINNHPGMRYDAFIATVPITGQTQGGGGGGIGPKK